MDERPKAHVFFSDKAEWLEISDELPKYGGTTGLEPLVKKVLFDARVAVAFAGDG